MDEFRQVYRPLSQMESALVLDIKEKAQTLFDTLNTLQPTRHRSLAMTKLEECVMWAVKGIT